MKNIAHQDALIKQVMSELRAGGFSNIVYSERCDTRKIVIWGIVAIVRSLSDGVVSITAFNEPKDSFYIHRHEAWSSKILGFGIDDEPFIRMYASWHIKTRLKVYGEVAEQLARTLTTHLRDEFGCISSNVWRRHYIRWLLDPEVCRLAVMAYGPIFTLGEYRHIAMELSTAKRVSMEAPNMMPALGWLMTALSSKTLEPSVQKLFADDANAPGILFDKIRQSLLRNYGEALHAKNEVDDCCFMPDLDLSTTKSVFTEGGWKLLVRLQRSVVFYLFESQKDTIPCRLQILEYLAAAGVVHVTKPAIMAMARHRIFTKRREHVSCIVRLARIIVAEIERRLVARQPLRPMLTQELDAIVDWLEFQGLGDGHPRRGASWQSLIRRSGEWHDERLYTNQVPVGVNVEWKPLLGEFSADGCHVRELSSSDALHEEGLQMRHCVGGYWKKCVNGTSRIFSMETIDGRSTVELSNNGGGWVVRQHYGEMNKRIPYAHQMFSRLLESECNDKNGGCDRGV